MAQYLALTWDKWEPKVESSIFQDLLEMKSAYPRVVVSSNVKDTSSLERLCRAIQIPVVELTDKFTVWKAYISEDYDVLSSIPDYAVDVYKKFVGTRKKKLVLLQNQEGYPALYETRNNRPAPIGLSPLTKPMPPRNGRYILPPWAYL